MKKQGNGYYTTVCFEHSIFTLDDNERLYSYSNQQSLSAYDKKESNELIKDVKRLM